MADTQNDVAWPRHNDRLANPLVQRGVAPTSAGNPGFPQTGRMATAIHATQIFHMMKLRATILVYLTFISLALSAEPWEGVFRWNNEGEQDKPGNVFKYVNLRLSIEQDGKVVFSCEVLWKPGMDADFGATIERNAVFDRTLQDGSVAKVVPFTFEDSNENKGTGEVEIRGSLATIRIVNTEVNFPEAARQYGTYQLQKQSP